MTVTGADPEQLRATATKFSQAADQLQGSLKGLSSSVSNASFWRGPDSERFRSEWNGQSVFSINAAVTALRNGAEVLRRNADEQDDASRADGGTTSRADGGTTSRLHGTDLGGSAPTNTNEMMHKLKDVEHTDDSSGYRIQRVMGADGTVRYIVYIGGTDASDGQTVASNYPAVKGEVDRKQLDAIKAYIDSHNPGAEVMLVGYSQGGMDAQNIAKTGELNVKQVVTFGSPARTDLDVPAVHLRAYGDEIPNSASYLAYGATAGGGALGGVPGALGGATLGGGPYAGSQLNTFLGSGNNNEYFAADSGVEGDMFKHHNDGYENVSKEYDKAVADGRQGGKYTAADSFEGSVIDEVDVDVNGDLHR